MRHNDLSSHTNQIVHPDSSPLFLAIFPALQARTGAGPGARDSMLGPDLATPLEKQPDVVPLLELHRAAGDVGAVVEDKGYGDLGLLDRLLDLEKVLSQLVPRQRVGRQRSFRQGSRRR